MAGAGAYTIESYIHLGRMLHLPYMLLLLTSSLLLFGVAVWFGARVETLTVLVVSVILAILCKSKKSYCYGIRTH